MKRILLLACLFAVPGFAQDKAPQSVPQSDAQTAEESDAVRKVTSKLDPGGHFYMYWNPDELRHRVTPLVQSFGKAMEDGPGANDEELPQVLDLAGKFYEQSGLDSVGGVGMSSIQKSGELVQTKSFALREGPADGLLWKVWSEEEDKLSGLRQLPATSAYAIYGQYRINAMWNWLQEFGDGTIIEDQLNELKREAKDDDVDLDKILNSLDGDWGYALTLDATKMVNVPGMPPDLKIPAPGVIAIANVNNPVLFQMIIEKLQGEGGKAKIETVDAGQLFIMPSPMPDLPFDLSPTLHYSKKQILFASTPALMKEMLENRATAKTSLLRDPVFRKFADARLVKANQMLYFSPLLSKSIADLAGAMADDSPEMKTLTKVLIGDGEPFGSLMTIKAEADGISLHTTANKRGMQAWIMQHGIPRFGPQMMMMGTMQRMQPPPVRVLPPPEEF